MAETVVSPGDPQLYRRLIEGKTFGIIGYGNQGRSQALNLRDSGLKVIVGNLNDSYFLQAKKDGFEVYSISEASEKSDIIFLLLPDEVQPLVFKDDIKPKLRDGNLLVMASGYNYYYGFIEPDSNVDVVMIAPRMIGWGVRNNFEKKKGFPALISIGNDHTGQAKDLIYAICYSLGIFREGGCAIWSSFKEETLLDLLTEQSWAGAMLYMFRAYYDVAVSFGASPESVILELYGSGELAKIAEAMSEVGLFKQLSDHSHTSQYGQLSRGPEYINERTIELMKENAENILNGKFAREWAIEQSSGMTVFRHLKMLASEHPMIKKEEELYRILGRNVDR